MKLVKRLMGLSGDQRGLTAIELAVVVAILAVLAAIVAGNTTGMSTAARGSSMSTDKSEVQKAVDNYKGQNPTSGYPVAGGLTVLTTTTAIVFTSTYTTNDSPAVTKTFVPDFLQRNVKHWDEKTPGTLTPVWQLDPNGQVVVNLSNSQY
ncbi:MAG: prepilin-type N-terminal cleavage/methylation domain-containing protein [Dehalococcoidia bacterium]|nr:prepilin-type N-terminal cleavage/methylation domain-containing protein [Dehalococcoidia bacterium]